MQFLDPHHQSIVSLLGKDEVQVLENGGFIHSSESQRMIIAPAFL